MSLIRLMALIAGLAAGPAAAQVQPIPQPRVSAPSSPIAPPQPGQLVLERPRPVTPMALPVPGPAVSGVSQYRASKIGNEQRSYGPFLADIAFVRLPPGAQVRAVTSVNHYMQVHAALDEPGLPRCHGAAFGLSRNSVTQPRSMGVVNARGEAVLAYGFSLSLPTSAPPLQTGERCLLALMIEVRETPTGESTFHLLKAPMIEPLLLRTVRYDRTWALRRYFDFTMLAKAPGSTCEGTSIGPVQNYPAGPFEHNGDLAVQIRSGPLGTACRAVSPGVAVDDQIRLVAIDWDIERTDDKCCAGGQCGEGGYFQPGHLPEDEPDRYQDLIVQRGISGEVQYPNLRDGQWVMGHAHINLTCEPALMNDHGVRLVLRSATFEAPLGAALP